MNLAPTPEAAILVAGIGNIFLGDDGFGPEAAAAAIRLGGFPGAAVADFGTRGLDLAFTLMHPWRLAILVDAVQRGEAPGTIYTIDPHAAAAPAAAFDPHAMTPATVLALVIQLGGSLPPLRVVGCEPAGLGGENGALGLSPAAAAAMPEALKVIAELVATAKGDNRWPANVQRVAAVQPGASSVLPPRSSPGT